MARSQSRTGGTSGGIAIEYDPLAAVNETSVSNAVLYGRFPVQVRRRGRLVVKELSAPARLTYIGLRSLDWSGKQAAWYSWAALCDLLRLTRRTLAEHLEELEAAHLLFRRHQPNVPTQPTVYTWGVPPLREVWRALMLKRWRCGFEPDAERITRPDGRPPRDRDEFDRLFDVWWGLNGDRLEDAWAELKLAQLRMGRR